MVTLGSFTALGRRLCLAGLIKEQHEHAQTHHHSLWWTLTDAGESQHQEHILDTGDSLVISLEIPGIKEESIRLLQHEDSFLELDAKKEPSRYTNTSNPITERPLQTIHRMLWFPGKVSLHNATTQYTQGVLYITLPKKQVNTSHHDE